MVGILLLSVQSIPSLRQLRMSDNFPYPSPRYIIFNPRGMSAEKSKFHAFFQNE